jgi:aspartate aminotransferase-like enzyme
MGYCSQKQFILQLLAAMDKALLDQGHRHSPGAGVAGAIKSYAQAETPAAVAR